MSKFDSDGDLVSQEANQSTMISQFVKHLKDQWDQIDLVKSAFRFTRDN